MSNFYSSTKTTRATFASVYNSLMQRPSMWFSYCCTKVPIFCVYRDCFECNKYCRIAGGVYNVHVIKNITFRNFEKKKSYDLLQTTNHSVDDNAGVCKTAKHFLCSGIKPERGSTYETKQSSFISTFITCTYFNSLKFVSFW